MRTLIAALLLTLAGVGLAHAGHDDGVPRYATPGHGYPGNHDIARAAHQMEYAAERFHEQLKHSRVHRDAARDAKRLAAEAREFRHEVEKGRDTRRVRDDYADLARAFEHARREFGGRYDWRHDGYFRADFRYVERAFANLNRAIYVAGRGYSRHGEPGRYAWNR